MNAGEGERLYAAQRKRFWMTIGALAFVGGLVGILGGFIWNFGDGPATLSPELIAAVSIGVIIAAVLTAYGSWRYFVSVDEVEVADNLWGSLIGFYAYSILFPTWWALWKLDQVSEPDDWSIFFTAMFVALAAYGWRKWQSR